MEHGSSKLHIYPTIKDLSNLIFVLDPHNKYFVFRKLVQAQKINNTCIAVAVLFSWIPTNRDINNAGWQTITRPVK